MLKNKTTYILAILFSILFVPACIDEYTPKIGNELSDILVVEGTISGGNNTVIKLSRSVTLSSEYTFNPVMGATVFVQRSDGWTSDLGVETLMGEYHIAMDELDTSLSYNLVIHADGKEYQSKPTKPLITSEIDSVSWKKKGDGEPVTIHVTAHDNGRDVGYYRWSYKEDWEITAPFFANGNLDIETKVFTPYFLNGLNTYYCWNKDSSRVLLLGDTEKLSGNLIYEKRLVSIDPFNDKISYLYSILVKQWAVSKPAYHYLDNLQSNIDEAGSIFAPQPSELKGNIECITSPGDAVIGYVDVATVAEKRLFITEKEVRDSGRRNYQCTIKAVGSKYDAIDTMKVYGYYLLTGSEDMIEGQVTERRCVDCNLRGNKIKPHFWPNDHI